MKEKINERPRLGLLVKIAVVTVFCFCIASIIRSQVELNRLRESRDTLASQITEYSEDIEELSDQIERPFDAEYIRRVARERLNYCLPDEIIFYNDLIK